VHVVATPVFAAFILRSRIGGLTWGAVVIAMAGLGVLTLSGLSIGFREALIFVAALMYALHIVGLGAWSDARQAIGMAIVQLMVITVICLVRTAPNGLVLPHRAGDWGSVLHGGLRRGRRDDRPDLGPGPSPAEPGGDHDEHGAGVRCPLRGAPRGVRAPVCG